VENNGKRLLTIKDVAYQLSLSTKTVRNLTARGFFKPNRSTAKLLFPVEQVEAFCRGGQ
jgi:DNA-binding transcriptional MerR regulator